ncbi:UPF0329 protein ECU05_1680/ECU11_0050 [Impatiens glandulifera]|uniref:UPF0329 protein ECU05_1680/ECU11_0050 n=1 Tax=Impatiens glandulifera TaxID=253017 RepID=UPI001FB0A0FC|nr:UPF0329 protein ECU05_1680/ECU11_0050 [Impatiens glandulifera]
MAASRVLLRSQTLKPSYLIEPFRSLSTTTTTTTTATSDVQSHGRHHRSVNHEFLPPNDFLNSWKAPKDPKEAIRKLALLRRDYAKQVKEIRKGYILEMELLRLEKQRKDDARKEALRIANEERKKEKAATKKALAAEREAADEQLRQTLEKERTEKLDYWRSREKKVQERKKEKKELLHKQSSLWIDESELAKRILEATIDSSTL